jgi:4-hydroxy-2-oxoheptanedioate aldolase
MELQPNRFKLGLAEGRRQFGIWLNLADCYSAEICAGAGFDWLVVDGEHAPNDIRSLLAQLQVLAAYPVHPIVRIPVGDTVLIKQVLDIGAQTIMVPMVESAEQAQALVRAMRYPPRGIRGVATAIVRASRWNRIADYILKADGELCLVAQIETRAGLERLEAIAAVEGVDALFLGPSDLAASLGHPGDSRHAEVQRALEDAIRRARAVGVPVGILATEESAVRRFLDLGCTFVGVGLDAGLLAAATQQLATKYRALSVPAKT